MAANLPFYLSDDEDMKQDNEEQEQLKAFVSLPDKIILGWKKYFARGVSL
jgi:hypothetical protein